MLQTRMSGRVFRDTLANFMASTRKWKVGDVLMPTDSPEFRLGIGTTRFSQLGSVPVNGIEQAELVAALGATTNLTAVPASFADLAAVRSYLVTLVGNAELRLDGVEDKIDQLIDTLKDANIMATT